MPGQSGLGLGHRQHGGRQVLAAQAPQADVGRRQPRIDFDDGVAAAVGSSAQDQIDANVAEWFWQRATAATASLRAAVEVSVQRSRPPR